MSSSHQPPQPRVDSEPFGVLKPPIALDLDDWPTGRSISERLYREMPDFGQLVDQAHLAMTVASRNFYGVASNSASLEVFNQAVNDFNDLLFDLCEARGRPATRAARALIEHLINLSDVVADDSLAERYLAHGALTPMIEAEAEVGIWLLKGRERRAAEHRLRSQARRHKQQATEAVAKYGSSFRRSWAEKNLRDRARLHGHEKFYHYYRLSSQILHGASGGARESMREIDGRNVYRSGLALSLLPHAYVEGVRAFKLILESMVEATFPVEAEEAVEACNCLLTAWPHYRRAVLKVDRQLWPRTAPEGPFALLAVSRSGKQRWYYHDPELKMIVEAQPPGSAEFTDAQRKGVERLTASITDDMFAEEDQWISILIAGVTVNPRPGARRIKETSILIPADSDRRLPIQIPVDPSGQLTILRTCGVRWLPPQAPRL
ncbi:DUF5677 domain-containing protein [Micromonospora sp. NPDC049900]|uniref:DUF5677 domain-containing protein n=1 Tax=Micromonospora sp. NPDC049900 TaxID=3364275 RepID=UPI0037A16F3E